MKPWYSARAFSSNSLLQQINDLPLQFPSFENNRREERDSW